MFKLWFLISLEKAYSDLPCKGDHLKVSGILAF